MNLPEQKKSPFRRIALYGGPGAGKSTIALFVAYTMKVEGYNLELVTECVKKDAYRGRPIEGELQRLRFDEQKNQEKDYLECGVDYIVTDSPVLLQYMYSHDRGELQSAFMLEESIKAEARFPSLNIWLNRTGVPYIPIGRFQKTLEEAEEVDRKLLGFLEDDIGLPLTKLKSVEKESIMDFIRANLDFPTLQVQF